MTPCWGLTSHCFIIGDDQSTQWRRVCITQYKIYKDARNWMWDDFIPQKTRLWTLAHVVLPVGFCEIIEIQIQLNHPKSHGIASHWWFQTHQPTSLKSRATFRGGPGGGLGKKPLILRADDDSTPNVFFFLLGWLFKAACMAFGSLALAVAATLKTPMVRREDTGKSRGFVDLQGGFTMDLLGKFSSREMIR